MKFIKHYTLWLLYFVFLGIAIATHENEGIIFSEGSYSAGKPVVWLIWLGFLVFTLHVNRRENFFKSLKNLWPNLWHRQIGADLYIGLLLPLFIIYLHSGSIVILMLWFAPIFIFANLATLVYLALNYQSLVNLF